MAAQPIVLEIKHVSELVQYVLNRHTPPSTLVVCSSKLDLVKSIQAPGDLSGEQEAVDELTASLRKLWQKPTLRLLSTSRTLKLVFCPDVTNLRAYLATYSISASKKKEEADIALRSKDVQPILAILSPIQLHRPTSAFSAQGLNRTFSAAVEAAHHTGSQLILAECRLPTSEPESAFAAGDSTEVTDGEQSADPWDEEVPILNVTTKRLGELSVGRTVKARTIAERWCTFQPSPALD